MTAPVVATALELETNRMLPVVSEVDPSVRASLVVSEFHSHSCALAAALLMVREAVAVSSEGGAAEEGEVEAGEAVHGLPQEGGARLNGGSGPEQFAKRTKLLILLSVLAMVNRSVESKARLRNVCNGEKQYPASHRFHSRWESTLGCGSWPAKRSRICSWYQPGVAAVREM